MSNMSDSDVQALLASAGYYTAAIDGIAGAKTMVAVEITERNAGALSAGWSKTRRLIAAGQRVLNAQGFEAGVVDGYDGHNTGEALTAWRSAQQGTDASVPRDPLPTMPDPGELPRQRECAAFYGQPGTEALRRHLVYAHLPFAMRIDWNLGQTVTRVRLHAKCAPSFEAAMQAVLDHYGLDQLRHVGIDRFAGSYVERRMRGSSSWSMHSYGCAVDFYAAPNSLRTRCPEALFCGPDYRAFLDIMEGHGWLPAIRLWGADAMHFQRARL